MKRTRIAFTTLSACAVVMVGMMTGMTTVGCSDSDNNRPSGTGGEAGQAGSGGGTTGGSAGHITGGTGGMAGSAGSGGSDPSTVANKIDLLLVIDNSWSMNDKQKILANAVPDLINRFVSPACLDASGKIVGESTNGTCAAGTIEFKPIKDIHIGVITSSLGSMTEDTCDDSILGKFNNDRGRLINRGKSADIPTYANKGFLAWDPNSAKTPPGESNVDALSTNFKNMVSGVGQNGCGYEMPLEAWYRFLADPDPYLNIEKTACSINDSAKSCTHAVGTDDIVLQQRKDFMRQDSLLVIVLLSDENDCSVAIKREPNQYNVILNRTFQLRPGTTACKTNPDSPECEACTFLPEKHNDPECQYDPLYDNVNLRCFEQKRRFGWDVLFPIKRYVDGLTQASIDGQLNPIFCTDIDKEANKCKVAPRDPSLVFFAGIVGVPWQDISVDPTTLEKGYRPSNQLHWKKAEFESNNIAPPKGLPDGKTLWDVILGQTNSDGEIVLTVDPLDPLMKESVDERNGTNPITGDAIATENAPMTNKINGHDRNLSKERYDLQYACIFELAEPILCQGGDLCECVSDYKEGNPLCFDKGTYPNTQFRAKAFPGRRQLAVLKGVGDQGIVSSICTAQLKDKEAADYGYRPTVQALVQRLAKNLEK